MLLSPSLSPSPLDSHSTTTMSSPPLPPPSPPLLTPHLAPTSTPPIQQPPLLPVISPPPPAAVAISPVTTPPLPPVVTSPPPTPPATTTVGPIPSPPPPALVFIPPPQPPTTLPLPPPSLILPPPLTTHPSLPPPPLTTAPSLPLPRLPIDPRPPPPPPQPPLVIIRPPLPPATLPLPPPSLIFPPPLTTAPSLPPPPLTTTPPLPSPFISISPPQPPASPAAPAASHSIKSPKTPGPFQAIPSPAQPPPPVSFQSFPPPAPPPPPPSLTLTGRKGGLSTTKQTPHSPIGLIVASIGVTILLFVVLALVCICCKRRRRKHKPLDTKKQQCSVQKDDSFAVSIQHKQGNVVNAALGSGSINIATLIADNTTLNSSIDGIFTYEELVIATDGFSESNLLGQGGFGYVYKGRLPTGQDVAVKKLKAGSRQGEREFRAEVETISRVHHKHLVSLVGYCINGAERLLVYEFVTNKTLEFHLYENGQPVMVWESRLKIAIGSAKGLAYLHEDCSPTIIHRDIKAANILLDMRFEAKVSDFGLAKIFFDASSSITHISTRVMGTFGYLAPEYALTGKLTDKSDVYSYGVVLLELITGRPPIIEQDSSTNQSLVDWARPLLARALEDNDFDTLVDQRLNGSYNKSKMASMVSCAAACIRQSAWLRPRMIQVVRALEDDISLPYLDEGTRFSNSSSNASSDTFIRNAKRCINDVGFREHYETTSDYGI